MKNLALCVLVCGLFLGGCTKSATNTSTTSATSAETSAPQAAASLAASPAGSPSAAAATVAAATPTGSPNPLASVQFSDIKGIFAETAIEQEAALGIFGTKTGTFNPYGPITRGDYVRWLVLANNAYFASPSDVVRLAEGNSDQTFIDVPRSNPNFKYIQGMANAGLLVGIDRKHFAPARNLTREEMLAILIIREQSGNITPVDVGRLEGDMGLADAGKISKPYWGPFDKDHWSSGLQSSKGITRVYGSIKYLQPQKQATRGEAAVALQQIMTHNAADAVGRGGPY